MSTLVLDFSSKNFVCAVCYEGKVISGGLFPQSLISGDQIPNQMFRVVGKVSLSRIVLGNGPGSYTGVRLACSVAQAFGYCKQLPIFPVCSLKGLLPQEQTAEEYLLIAMAGRSRYHGICFDARLRRWGQPVVCSWEEVERILRERQLVVCSSFSGTFPPSTTWQRVELNPLMFVREACSIGFYPRDLYNGLELLYNPDSLAF
ncbi:tRNA threonylcarbamoyladenosine biosynthesis protein TsaB [Candidatus Similichlamydia laticola]|uniref:tRNA threonylcarbamoyladenosine biosynthesis protein TsaB n=1 Tax=Candidatus Similichlamydia laticola TaxID=2170265 RepID=UPI0015EFE552|nr:hypothetical protein [Candidatus Similichlamydia laticola]